MSDEAIQQEVHQKTNPSYVAALRAFFAAWRAAAVYDEKNQAYQARRSELADALDAVFADHTDFTVVYQNDYLFVNGQRLNYDRSLSFGRALTTRLEELHLGGIAIQQDASTDAIDRALFTLAGADRRVDDPYMVLNETWQTVGIPGISISPLSAHTAVRQAGVGVEDVIDPRTRRRRRARALFYRSETVVRDCWDRVRDDRGFEAAPMQRIVHQLIDEVAHDEDVLVEFATLKEFDEYTFFHSVNVAIYSLAVGMRLGLDRTTLAELGMAALFHDIGKVKLPKDLITKPTEFNEDDWAQMRRHPMLGALTIASLRPLDGPTGTAIATAFEHHLKMDLSGYPSLSGPRHLHFFSRIVTVCDAFDAMTSGRVYQKDRIQPDEAMRRLLYKAKEWYDPIVMKAFVNVVGVFPVGTLARLSDDTLALVVRNNPDDLYSPDLLVIRDTDNEPTWRMVTLKIGESESLHITAVLDPVQEGIDIHKYIGKDQGFSLMDDSEDA